MHLNSDAIMKHLPTYLSGALLLFWLGTISIIYNFDFSFMVGLMIWVAFVLITAISWKDGLIGGILWLLAGGVYLVIALGKSLSYMGATPIFLIGVLYVHKYFGEEKKEGETDNF